MRGHATGVDLTARVVQYASAAGGTGDLSYDRLLLAPGSVTRLLDIPGLAEHAIGLKTVTEALHLRDHVLGQLETANELADPAARQGPLTFIVVGAGYAGVELTAQMARLTRNLLPLHPNVAAEDIRWILVDVATTVMPELGASLGETALQLLKRRCVDVRLGVSVTAVTDNQVMLTDGSALNCSTVIWRAGITANPLIATLNIPTTKGRLNVDASLQLPGHPEVYAIGDAVAVPDLSKPADQHGIRPVCPPPAQHAMRQATAASRNILADLRRAAPLPPPRSRPGRRPRRARRRRHPTGRTPARAVGQARHARLPPLRLTHRQTPPPRRVGLGIGRQPPRRRCAGPARRASSADHPRRKRRRLTAEHHADGTG